MGTGSAARTTSRVCQEPPHPWAGRGHVRGLHLASESPPAPLLPPTKTPIWHRRRGTFKGPRGSGGSEGPRRGVVEEQPSPGWQSQVLCPEELPRGWGAGAGLGVWVGVARREEGQAGPRGAGRAAGAGEGPGSEAGLGLCPAVAPWPCPASARLLISSFSPFMVFPVAVAFINKHFGDLPLRTSAPQESRALNIYK